MKLTVLNTFLLAMAMMGNVILGHPVLSQELGSELVGE